MPPCSSIKRSMRRRRRKRANRKKQTSNPAARKRKQRRRLLPEHRAFALCAQRTCCPLILLQRSKTRWAHRLESLGSVSGREYFIRSSSYNRFRQKHSGSIFGTAISQARNKFDRDNFVHRTLIDTASVAYSPRKIAGTRSA